MAVERETEENADERREAAMAAAVSLRLNFKPKIGIAETRVSKFRELHERRLQIKERSKANKRDKGEPRRTRSEAIKCINEEPNNDVGESSTVSVLRDILSIEEDNVAGNSVANKRRKLHWGLDTKERWERKSNM